MYLVSTLTGCPAIIRADRGTENSIVAFFQPALRHHHLDNLAREKSFQYGRSSANQVCYSSYYGPDFMTAVSNLLTSMVYNYSELRPGGHSWWIDFFNVSLRTSAFNRIFQGI